MTGKKSKAKIAFILFLINIVVFLNSGSVLAKEPEFQLNIDSENLQKGVSTNLVLSMIDVNNADEIDIKGLENFEVLSTSQSTSTEIVNWKSTTKNEIHYTIMPKNAGEFTLQGNVKFNGKTYTTNELKIKVSEAAQGEKGIGEEVFIKTKISDEDIYSGQKIALIYELYSRYNIESCNTTDAISVDGLLINDIKQDKIERNIVDIGGTSYAKYEVKKMFVLPIKAGEYNIPSFKFLANVITSGGFFSNTQQVYLQSEPKKLTVKPLPQKDQPADFSGIVGKVNVEANYSRQDMNVGDSLTLKVKASGNCNLGSFDKIIKNDIPGFTVYETAKDLKESIENNKYSAEKEFEVILVPEKNGEIKIDPVYIPYFDPETGSYAKAEISGTTIKVNGEMPQSQTQAKNGTKDVETVKIDQVSYNTADDGYLTIQIKKNYVYIALVIVLILLVLAGVVFFLLKSRKGLDKNLQEMYKQLKKTNDKSEIYNILNSMIKYRFNLSLKASSRSTIIDKLADQELVKLVLEIMDYIENEKQQSDQGNTYLKDRIKDVYNKLVNVSL